MSVCVCPAVRRAVCHASVFTAAVDESGVEEKLMGVSLCVSCST